MTQHKNKQSNLIETPYLFPSIYHAFAMVTMLMIEWPQVIVVVAKIALYKLP